MPLYEELARRALAARKDSERLQHDVRQAQQFAQFLRDARDGRVTLVHCAWCGCFRLGEEWLHLEAIGRGQLQITHALRKKASHGICPDCFDMQLQISREHHGQRTQPAT